MFQNPPGCSWIFQSRRCVKTTNMCLICLRCVSSRQSHQCFRHSANPTARVGDDKILCVSSWSAPPKVFMIWATQHSGRHPQPHLRKQSRKMHDYTLSRSTNFVLAAKNSATLWHPRGAVAACAINARFPLSPGHRSPNTHTCRSDSEDEGEGEWRARHVAM